MLNVYLEKRKEVDKLVLNIIEFIESDSEKSDKECKQEFLNFLDKLKKITPFTNEEYVKYNKFKEDKLSCIFAEYRMYHIKLLLRLKKYVLKEKWEKVLECLIDIDRGCDFLDKKIYYSIIDIL